MGPVIDDPLFDPLDPIEETTGPPWLLLAAAAGCVLISAALLLGSGSWINLLGYALAAVVAVTFVGVFRNVDGRRRGRASYRLSGLPRAISIAILVLCWACAAAHAWFLATEWAR